MSIDPGEGYRLLREGEQMLVTDEYCDLADNWKQTDECVERDGCKWSADEWLPHRRKRVPLDNSLERLLAAMSQPNWSAALFGELPEELRNDLHAVLTHYLGVQP